MRSLMTTAATFVLILAMPALASEDLFDGDWKGQGSSESSECPDFDFWVSVKGDQVRGKARQTGTDYEINGILSAKGSFSGTVTYMLFDIAELKGNIGVEQGVGNWKALKGPDCSGSFIVYKLG